MLSYQHMYHAGSIADVHKHMVLLEILQYLTKNKSNIHYYETHAGRGLYNLESQESKKTQESLYGIKRMLKDKTFLDFNNFLSLLAKIHKKYGRDFYPGSPFIAEMVLRNIDEMYLMELHPKEISELRKNIKNANIYHKNGYDNLLSILRKDSAILIDPSYEIKQEYQLIPDFINKVYNKFPSNIIMLWYPILRSGHYKKMQEGLLSANFPNNYSCEIIYPEREYFRMLGTGLFIVNLPDELKKTIDNLNKSIFLFLKGCK